MNENLINALVIGPAMVTAAMGKKPPAWLALAMLATGVGFTAYYGRKLLVDRPVDDGLDGIFSDLFKTAVSVGKQRYDARAQRKTAEAGRRLALARQRQAEAEAAKLYATQAQQKAGGFDLTQAWPLALPVLFIAAKKFL